MKTERALVVQLKLMWLTDTCLYCCRTSISLVPTEFSTLGVFQWCYCWLSVEHTTAPIRFPTATSAVMPSDVLAKKQLVPSNDLYNSSSSNNSSSNNSRRVN